MLWPSFGATDGWNVSGLCTFPKRPIIGPLSNAFRTKHVFNMEQFIPQKIWHSLQKYNFDFHSTPPFISFGGNKFLVASVFFISFGGNMFFWLPEYFSYYLGEICFCSEISMKHFWLLNRNNCYIFTEDRYGIQVDEQFVIVITQDWEKYRGWYWFSSS